MFWNKKEKYDNDYSSKKESSINYNPEDDEIYHYDDNEGKIKGNSDYPLTGVHEHPDYWFIKCPHCKKKSETYPEWLIDKLSSWF